MSDNPWSSGIRSFFQGYTPAAVERQKQRRQQGGINKLFDRAKEGADIEDLYADSQTIDDLEPEIGSKVVNAISSIRESKRKSEYETRRLDLEERKLSQKDEKPITPYQQARLDLEDRKLNKNKDTPITPYQEASLKIRNRELKERGGGAEVVRKYVDSVLKDDMEIRPSAEEKLRVNKDIANLMERNENLSLAEAADEAFNAIQERRDLINDTPVTRGDTWSGRDENDIKKAALEIGQLMNEVGYGGNKAQFAKIAKKNGWSKKEDIDYMWDLARQSKQQQMQTIQQPAPTEKAKGKTTEDAESILFGL